MRTSLRRVGFCVLMLLVSSCKNANGHRVEYTVTGSAKHVALTYQNSDGGTDQRGSGLPFSYAWSGAEDGDFLYISAQIDTSPDAGNITVSILKDGKTAYTGHASGFPNIATASGSY